MSATYPLAAAPLRVGAVAPAAQTERLRNPAALSEEVGSVGFASRQHAEAAVEAALAAFPIWRAVGSAARAEALLVTADAVAATRDEWALLLTREHGKTLREAHAELAAGEQILRYYASLAEVADREDVTTDVRGTMIVRRQPMGPVAVIVPWNYPVVLAMLMLAPALLAGNTVVLKLPDHSPFTLSAILAELERAVPAGTLSVLAGSGEEVGAALTTHPAIRKVMFTGSTETGRRIMAAASNTLKNLSLELGGNDAALVLQDADLDLAARELVAGAFTASGQVCYAPKRIYVHRTRLEEFVEAFTGHAADIVVGDGRAPEVGMGPVNNRAQYDRLNALLSVARASGADVYELGRWAEGLDPTTGYFLRPTLVAGVDEEHPLVVEEQFGPVVPVLAFDEEAEAFSVANRSEYGLAASVWSRDAERAFSLGRQIEAGTVFVNVHRVGASDPSMPFGGVKQSGIGRGHGRIALEDCMELQVLAQRHDMTGEGA